MVLNKIVCYLFCGVDYLFVILMVSNNFGLMIFL